MDKNKMITLIEQELVQADEANSEADFQKHMYAIHTLTALYTENIGTVKKSVSQKQTNDYQMPSATVSSKQYSANEVTTAEIEAMGGKVSHTSNVSTPPGNSNKMVTDDELGNGDSIFDF